jgi:nucleotide-binding universal stress UspA family protein
MPPDTINHLREAFRHALAATAAPSPACAAGAEAAGRLLVATDLSPRSDRAVRRAADLARSLGAELVLLYVVDDDQPADLAEAERGEALALLRGRASELAEMMRDLPARVLVEAGDTSDGIIRAAEAEAADLILVGAQRRSPLRDILAGTTAERVLRHGHRPVLVVNRPPSAPYRRILAAVDLDEISGHALRRAAMLGLLDGADLTVLHAFRALGRGTLMLADASEEAIADHLQARASEARAEIAAFLAGLGLDHLPPPRMVVEEGKPAAVVREVAERLRPDLVLLGTRRRGALHNAVLGSVAARAVAELDCDVLLVPPGRPRWPRPGRQAGWSTGRQWPPTAIRHA